MLKVDVTNFNYMCALSEVANAYKTGNLKNGLCFLLNKNDFVALLTTEIPEIVHTEDEKGVELNG